MGITEGLKEIIAGRKAAKERVQQTHISQFIEQQESFLMFMQLWNLHFNSKNYEEYVNSELTLARKKKTLKTVQLYAKLKTLPFFKEVK